ncbi:MAG: TetR family transcriptional regulator [Tepidisphaeraceae bacterium]
MKQSFDMAAASKNGSAEILLNTAEALFSASGYDGVSMRDLTREAGVNLAAVNYHFGSKEQLFQAVIRRRVAPLNARRLEALDLILKSAGNRPPDLAAVLEAFARPIVVDLMRAGHEPLRRLAVRLFTAADPLVEPIIDQEFGPVARRFIAAFAAARPGLSSREINMGFVFFLGATVKWLSMKNVRVLKVSWEGAPPSEEEALEALVRCGVAMFDSFPGNAAKPAKRRGRA